MSSKMMHPFHMVDEAPWPLSASIFSMGMASGLVKWFHSGNLVLFILSMVGILLVSAQWWRDVSREGSDLGSHSKQVEAGLRLGMILFIISEVMLFFSFFWAYFHSSLGPSHEVGSSWPPMGVSPFSPFGAPLLNSVILISSGVSVTWAHHSLVKFAHKDFILGLTLTIILGAYFSYVQILEYKEAMFLISDGSYGSTFFLATGFHGLHVLVGTLFLISTLGRGMAGKFSSGHHFGFEASAWYWHFVDVVWLFLYLSIYWWGGLF